MSAPADGLTYGPTSPIAAPHSPIGEMQRGKAVQRFKAERQSVGRGVQFGTLFQCANQGDCCHAARLTTCSVQLRGAAAPS